MVTHSNRTTVARMRTTAEMSFSNPLKSCMDEALMKSDGVRLGIPSILGYECMRARSSLGSVQLSGSAYVATAFSRRAGTKWTAGSNSVWPITPLVPFSGRRHNFNFDMPWHVTARAVSWYDTCRVVPRHFPEGWYQKVIRFGLSVAENPDGERSGPNSFWKPKARDADTLTHSHCSSII
jgi:hypothetical protein